MAVSDWDRLTSITRKKVLPAVVHQVKKDLPGFGHFLDKAKKVSEGGSKIDRPVTYKFGTRGGSYSGLEVLNTNQEDTRTRAEWDWKQVYEPIVIDNMELFKNGGKKSSEETVVKLLSQEMEEAEINIKNNLAKMFYGDGTGNSGKDLNGLVNLVDDSTDVAKMGGIDYSSNSWWQANVQTSVGTLSLSHMRSQYSAAKSGSDKPKLILTTENLRDKYADIHQSNVRYNFSGNGAPKIDTIGGGKMFFRGAEVKDDEYCNSNEMYFLNEDYMKLYVGDHPKHPTDENGFTNTPMREPTDQDGQVGFILFYAQLICERPSRQSKSQGVTS